MEDLCENEKNETQFETFIEDMSDDLIAQEDMNIEKFIVIGKFQASKVVDKRVVVFEVELTINSEYAVYQFEGRLDERPTLVCYILHVEGRQRNI